MKDAIKIALLAIATPPAAIGAAALAIMLAGPAPAQEMPYSFIVTTYDEESAPGVYTDAAYIRDYGMSASDCAAALAAFIPTAEAMAWGVSCEPMLAR